MLVNFRFLMKLWSFGLLNSDGFQLFLFLGGLGDLGFNLRLNSPRFWLGLCFVLFCWDCCDLVGLIGMLIMMVGVVAMRLILPSVSVGLIEVDSIFLLTTVLEGHLRMRSTVSWHGRVIGIHRLVQAREAIWRLAHWRVFHLLL